MTHANHRDLISDANVRRFLFNHATKPTPMTWLDRIATGIQAQDEITKTYSDVGSAPRVTKFTGKRETLDQRFDEYSITSEMFNLGTRVKLIDLTLDKMGLVDSKMAALATRWSNHWVDLAIAALKAGETALCYDQAEFFATDHQSGESPVQSNIVEHDVATPANPTPAETEIALWSAVERFSTFLDDNKQPIDLSGNEFVVVAPVTFARSLAAATGMAVMPDSAGGMNALVTASGKTFQIVTPTQIGITDAEVHGTAWTTQFSVHLADSRSLIRQTLANWENKVDSKAEGSDYEFDMFAREYGISGWRAVGYGDWKSAVLVKLVTS